MRPSDEKGVVGILDTYDECVVIDDYFQRQDRIAHDRRPDLFDVMVHAPRSRFIREAQELRGGYATDGEPYLRFNPTFRILEEDIEWVNEATRYVLDEKRLIQRIFNRITKRQKAAEDMASFILSYQQAKN